MARTFQVNVRVEHGQLHEYLALESDRQLMIDRLEEILLGSGTPPAPPDVRDGVIQILIDQLRTNNGHEPLFIRTGLDPREKGVEEQIEWVSEIVETRQGHPDKGKKKKIKVKVDKFRDTPRTPHTTKPGNPFKFNGGDDGDRVHSTDHKNKGDSIVQKFYKFSLEAKDVMGIDLELDPCIICDR